MDIAVPAAPATVITNDTKRLITANVDMINNCKWKSANCPPVIVVCYGQVDGCSNPKKPDEGGLVEFSLTDSTGCIP